MGMRRVIIGVAAIAVTVPAPAAARVWQPAAEVAPGTEVYMAQAAPLPLGRTVSVFQRIRQRGSEIVARTSGADGTFGDEQILSPAPSFYPTLTTDGLGEAFAAWYSEGDGTVSVATRGAGAAAFADPVVLPSSGSDFSQGAPKLAASPLGNAAVLFLRRDAGGQHAYVSYRPAGGTFGPPESITAPGDTVTQIPRSIAVNDAGVVVAGYLQDGYARVAVRSPGADGTWDEPEALGEPNDGWSWRMPLVGLDALGNAVAVWGQGGADAPAALHAAFRRPGGVFGAPQDLGVDTSDGEAETLGVSAFGEVILVARPITNFSGTRGSSSGYSLQPLVAVSGSTRLGRFGAPHALSDDWTASDPLVAMNARGDALVTYDQCCPMRIGARRRAPFGAFGADEDVVPPLTFTGARGGRVVRDTRLDELGNAAVLWTDFEPQPSPLLVSRDGPLVGSVPAVVAPAVAAITSLFPVPAVPVPAVPATPVTGTPSVPAVPLPPLPATALPPTLALPPVALPTGTTLPAGVAAGASGGLAQLTLEASAPVLGGPGGGSVKVTLGCSSACAASVGGTLSGSDGAVYRLPSVGTELDRAAVARVTLPLTREARRALRGARARTRSARSRSFTLRIRATARGRDGKLLRARAVTRFRR